MLPIPISVCSIFVCPDSGMAVSAWIFFNVHMDVDACDCTWALYGHQNWLKQ